MSEITGKSILGMLTLICFIILLKFHYEKPIPLKLGGFYLGIIFLLCIVGMAY